MPTLSLGMRDRRPRVLGLRYRVVESSTSLCLEYPVRPTTPIFGRDGIAARNLYRILPNRRRWSGSQSISVSCPCFDVYHRVSLLTDVVRREKILGLSGVQDGVDSHPARSTPHAPHHQPHAVLDKSPIQDRSLPSQDLTRCGASCITLSLWLVSATW